MRTILLLLFCISVLLTYGQNVEMHKNVISVYGNTTFTRTISGYKARIVIHSNEHIKNKDITSRMSYYLTTLQEKGIDTSKFNEKKLEFSSSSYHDKGTILEFTTTSAEEIKKLLNIQFDGIIPVFKSYKMDIDDKTYDEIFQKGIEDAERKAKKMAKRVEKKIGIILSIRESPLPKSLWTSEIHEENFSVQVVFEML